MSWDNIPIKGNSGVNQEVREDLERGDERSTSASSNADGSQVAVELWDDVNISYKRLHSSTSTSSSYFEKDPAVLARRRIQIERYNEMMRSHDAKKVWEYEREVKPKSSAHNLCGLLERYIKQQASATLISPILLYWDFLLKQLPPQDAAKVEKEVTMAIWEKMMSLKQSKN